LSCDFVFLACRNDFAVFAEDRSRINYSKFPQVAAAPRSSAGMSQGEQLTDIGQ